MDGSIAHLSSHYRMVAPQVAVSGLASRLDRVLRQGVIENYEAALQKTLGDDKAVYVLRRVTANMTVTLDADASDAAVARSWGSQLASAAMRAIARADDQPGDVVRFENHADYVAHYLVARLKGTDHNQWFYAAFAELSALDRVTAIRRGVLDNREHLAAILRYVHQAGQLDALISVLDAQTKRVLWSIESDLRSDLNVDRSLFLLALQFVDELEVWARIRRDAENLFWDYLEIGPRATDWREPRSLAVTVFEVVRFLFVQGYLVRHLKDPGDFLLRLNRTLENFEWLDREWLVAAVVELFETSEQKSVDLPARLIIDRATPRQHELISAIARLLEDSNEISVANDPEAAALKLFGLLAVEFPDLAADTAAKVMIESLISVATTLQVVAAPADFVKRLQAHDIEGALRLLRPEQRERARRACRLLSRLGQPALAVVEKFSSETKPVVPIRGVESKCAGLSLLLRAALDIRLQALAEEAAYPPASKLPRSATLFLLAALRLGGESAAANGRIDEGLRILAGVDQDLDLGTLRDCWFDSGVPDHARFQNALLRMASGQRLIRPDIMYLFLVDLPSGRRAIVAADESGTLWPLGRVVDTEAQGETAVRDWQTIWEDATGVRPRVIAGDRMLASMLERAGGVSVRPHDEETQATFDNGRKALVEALEVLQSGQTDDQELDLTMAIVACLLLRAWARWLLGFSASSVPFLVKNFLRRRGKLQVLSDCLCVELETGPLDMVLEMAGYLAELDAVPWLPSGRVRFLLEGV